MKKLLFNWCFIMAFFSQTTFAQPNDCGCDFSLDFVCVFTDDGEQLVFPNACFAACEGYSEDLLEDCNIGIDPSACEALFSFSVIDSLTFEFIDVSPGATSWSWNFGDGNTSTDQNPTHTYAEIGAYEVTLTIEGDSCSSTFVQVVYAGDFFGGCDCEFDLEPVCVTGPDGEVNFFPNDCFAACAGFTMADFVDCDDPIDLGCYASFSYILSEENTLTIDFTNESLGEATSWLWDFGDGNSSTEENPTHTYAAEGNYDVIFSISGNNCESTIVLHVSIGEIPPFDFCQAFFYSDVEADNGVAFVDFSFVENIDTWSWDFGDGNTSTEQNPFHIYAEEGEYLVTLTIEADSCTSTIELPVHVEDFVECLCNEIYAPVCVMDVDGNEITFLNACIAECEGYGEEDFVACENIPVDCECDFTFEFVCVLDAETGATLTFPNECWAACEGYGAEDLVACDNTPGNCECTGDFDPVCVMDDFGNEISFPNACWAACEGYEAANLVECENIPVDCECDFTFELVCAIDVETGLTLTFPNACWAACEGYEATDLVECGNDWPIDCYTSFYYLQNDPTSLTVNFIHDNWEDNTVSWSWDFGDGNTSTDQDPTHSYVEEGIYEVTLTTTTEDGCESFITQHICLGDGGVIDFTFPDCQAFFFFVQGADNASEFQFIDFSFGGATSWSWDFGDGNTSTEQNPIHIYAEAGEYEVILTITAEVTGVVCESSLMMVVATDDNVWYNNECSALFIPLVAPDDNNVSFINLSSEDAVSFAWDFGDGVTSAEASPTHEYAMIGSYEVTLTTTTVDGCVSSISMTVDLLEGGFMASANSITETTTSLSKTELLKKVSLFPNPVVDQLSIQFVAEKEDEYQLEIIDLSGKILMNKTHQIIRGENTIKLNVASLPTGLYFAKLTNGEASSNLKFVK